MVNRSPELVDDDSWVNILAELPVGLGTMHAGNGQVSPFHGIEALAIERESRQRAERHHLDGHPVVLRALPDYDALFGVDFTAPPRKEATTP